MGLSSRQSRAGGWRVVARLVAAFLLATIVRDLPDAWCDPLPLPLDRAMASLPPPAGTDACAEICVPDCFCCSSIVPALQPMRIERPAAPAGLRTHLVPAVAAGFSTVPEHVPIAEL